MLYHFKNDQLLAVLPSQVERPLIRRINSCHFK
jgi:hypothetical protein